ncbi:MAG: glycosyltransferase [candidate division WOR-3 bacterium]
MDKNLVSIIIPTYNQSQFLANSLNSVLCQTYRTWEILIIDDGSVDDTKKVVENFIKKYNEKIKYFYQENKGQASARNLGIRISKGEYVAFLDSDDEWLPEKIEKQVKFLKAYPEYAMVFTDVLIISDGIDNKRLSDINKPFSGMVFAKLLKNNFITNSSVMVRKKIFFSLGYLDESPLLRNLEDYDMWLRIAKNYKIGYIPEVLVKYNYFPKITNWQKRKIVYKARLYIYKKHFNFQNMKYFLVLIKVFLEYIVKYLIASFIMFFENENNNLFSIEK